MLVNFRFKNHRSFYQEAKLSLEATKDSSLDEINTFDADKTNKLLKSAVIFGGNASGKTNVIKALAYMKNVILLSASQLPVVRQNETFSFYEDAINEDSLFEAEFIYNKVFYKYGFIINQKEIKEEWLEKKIERLATVFRRKGNEIIITGPDKAAAKLINLSSNSLFLSVGRNFHLDIAPALNDVMSWFQNLLIVFENNANSLDIYTLEDGKYRDKALKILKLADIGIKDMEVKKDKIVNMSDPNDILRFNSQLQIQPSFAQGQIKQEENNLFNIDMVTEFDVYDKNKRKVSKKDVMLFKDKGFNSEGTERLLCYLGWILLSLDQGKVIAIDEIDSKLHFLVADYLLKLFNSIDNNPKNAQLVCTAHDVMLMDEDLRRDQIYFTSKDEYGESNLVALSDYKNVRKENLFSKRYLAGFYSKLPDMTRDL